MLPLAARRKPRPRGRTLASIPVPHANRSAPPAPRGGEAPEDGAAGPGRGESVPRPDPIRIFDLDTAFHRAYVEGGAGPRLLALHDSIKPQAERYIRLYISSLVDEIATSVVEHEVIARHIDLGEPLAAQEAVDTNWRNAAVRLSKVIGAHGERGSW